MSKYWSIARGVQTVEGRREGKMVFGTINRPLCSILDYESTAE
jgi:hypothetical protein